MKTANIEVECLGHFGGDHTVANAARVSFHKDACNYTDEQNDKLIAYLARNKHFSPFNHAFLSFRVKAPIFVARQLVKHRFMPWNEVSRRYVDEEPEFYVPEIWRKKAENVKQGSGEETLPKPKANGKCLYCGATLPLGRTKYCSDSHQAIHSRERLPYNTKYSRWKASAKATNTPFDIQMDDLDWPRHCPYLDMELNYGSDALADNVASLDKIKPELGYVKGNVQIVSLLANKMKSSASNDQILTFAKNSALIHGGVFMDSADSYEKYLEECVNTYRKMINDGYCAEQARIFLPQSMHTEWVWSGTLGAFLDMLVLRLDPHTQKETQEVARIIAGDVYARFPVSYTARIVNA